MLANDLTLVGRESRRVAQFFERYDLLLTPTLAKPPVLIGELLPTPAERFAMKALHRLPVKKLLDLVLDQLAADALAATPNTMLFNQTGQPAMSVPLSWNEDSLPIGVQVVASSAAPGTVETGRTEAGTSDRMPSTDQRANR